jgi:hypothetical protein
MLDFLRGMKRPIVLLLALGISFVFGCKSPANQAEEERAAAKKNAKGQSASDAASNAASQARGDNSGGNNVSDYQRTGTRPRDDNRPREDTSSDEETKKETYEGGDPDLFHPPVHRGQPREKIVEGKASTPTPTPTRPIDRPLDPSGKPLTSPTPEG